MLQGNGCPKCGVERIIDKLKVPYSVVKDTFKKRGYTLLSTEYIGGHSKLRYLCPTHGEQSISYTNLKAGKGCPKCGKVKASNKTKNSYGKVKKDFEDRGYALTSKTYINTHTKLQYLCPQHGEQSISHGNLMSGFGCPMCYFENNHGKNSSSWKGGISSLNKYLRGIITNWSKESIENANYTCCITGIRGKSLAVHHQYGFNLLVKDTLMDTGLPIKQSIGEYTTEELEDIKCIFMDKHKLYEPVVLQKFVHILFHTIYGRGDNTPEQFQEFRERYNLGEFTDQLNHG